MMSGYGPNPILFNKKKKTILDIQNTCYPTTITLHPKTSHSFLPYPLHPPPPESGRHTCITPNGVLFT